MSNKHTAADLKQLQSMPLELKIRATKMRIEQWYDHWEGMVYVSFSGGKDSTVLKHIVDSMYDDVPSLFVDTGLEYPEIRRFAASQKNVTVVRPEMRFDEVLKKHGYPVIGKEQAQYIYEYRHTTSENMRNRRLNGDSRGRFKISNKWAKVIDAPFEVHKKCCDVMKKRPAAKFEKETRRKPIIGTMTEESSLRKNSWIKYGCNVFDTGKPSSQPLSFWTEQDILEYIDTYKIPYCREIYGEIIHDENGYHTTGASRTGCIFCGFGCHLEKEPNRFQELKKTHPKQWNYCINGGEYDENGIWRPSKEGLGMCKVLDYIGVNYE